MVKRNCIFLIKCKQPCVHMLRYVHVIEYKLRCCTLQSIMFAYLIYAGRFLTEVYELYVPLHFFVLFGLVREFTLLAFFFLFSVLIFLNVICPELKVLYVNKKIRKMIELSCFLRPQTLLCSAHVGTFCFCQSQQTRVVTHPVAGGVSCS